METSLNEKTIVNTKQPLTFGQLQYSEEELNFLQESLNDKLGESYITSRPGPGGKPVHYISTATAISLANQTFGFNGWSSEITTITIDYVDQLPSGRFRAGISAIVRVTLKDGTFHEDVGYGHVDNIPEKGQALENSKKRAISDALKRALRHFGNSLGLTVYDKDHIIALAKSKTRPKLMNKDNTEVGHNSRPQNPHFKVQSNIDSQIYTQNSIQPNTFTDSDFKFQENEESNKILSNLQPNGVSNLNNGVPPQNLNPLNGNNQPNNNERLENSSLQQKSPPKVLPLPPSQNLSLQNGQIQNTHLPLQNNNQQMNIPQKQSNSNVQQINLPPQKTTSPQLGLQQSIQPQTHKQPPFNNLPFPPQVNSSAQNNMIGNGISLNNNVQSILGKRLSPPQPFIPNKIPRT